MTPKLPPPRGGTLIIALILLAVLSALGVAAVSLGSRERQNASGKSRVDALVACAYAARAQVWAELARYGPGYLTGTQALDAPIDLAGYGTLTAPAHYDTTTSMHVNDVVARIEKGASDGTLPAIRDLTNLDPRAEDLTSGRVYRLTARCTDARGNAYEVEFSMRLALF